MKCKTHPAYQLKKPPKSSCQSCWILWLQREVEILKNKVSFLERQEALYRWWK